MRHALVEEAPPKSLAIFFSMLSRLLAWSPTSESVSGWSIIVSACSIVMSPASAHCMSLSALAAGVCGNRLVGHTFTL